MKRFSQAAFTLIEMLTVMLIIAIIASLIVSVAGLANKKSTLAKAQAEITALGSACENYKADNGTYPRLGDITEQSSKELRRPLIRACTATRARTTTRRRAVPYQQLSGDTQLVGHPPAGVKLYFEFKNSMLAGMSGGLKEPARCFTCRIPSASPTATPPPATARRKTTVTPSPRQNAPRPYPQGYNTTFDLWSTGGLNTTSGGLSTTPFAPLAEELVHRRPPEPRRCGGDRALPARSLQLFPCFRHCHAWYQKIRLPHWRHGHRSNRCRLRHRSSRRWQAEQGDRGLLFPFADSSPFPAWSASFPGLESAGLGPRLPPASRHNPWRLRLP